MIADAHVHFFSHRFFELLGRPDAPAVLGWDAPDLDPVILARQWREELRRNNVARAVLIASAPGDHESVARAVGAFPETFYGYFMCNPCAPDAVATARAALGAGLRGVCFFPAMHRYSMHDDRVTAVLDEVRGAPGALAFVHCGVLSVGVRKKLGLGSPFDMRYSNPLDLHEVALRYPGVPFVVPHFGAGLFREALMLVDLCSNVYLDTSSSNNWMWYEGLTLVEVFRRALDVAGPQRLLFGTDSSYFPRGWNGAVYGDQADALRTLDVSIETANDIFGGNLVRLLG